MQNKKNRSERVTERFKAMSERAYLTCSDVFLISTFKSAFKDAIMPIRQAEGL